MKTIKLIGLCFLALTFASCKDKTTASTYMVSGNPQEIHIVASTDSLQIIPIGHASMVLVYGDDVIYIDPVGSPDLYKDQEPPDYVFITDIHSDHFDRELLKVLDLTNTTLFAPKAVTQLLPLLSLKATVTIHNGEIQTFENLMVEAVPMYNLREEALKFHEKGRGNGYVLTLGNQRIYISGDTEDIPEMRNLKAIDVAFVCMNLPYTMTVEKAADAVLEFKPKKVVPYHYRGTDGYSDVTHFKTLINNSEPEIDVELLNWYR